jgi:Holliday junction resolvase
MKRIPRNPEKFDVLDLYSAIGKTQNLKLNDAESQEQFLQSISRSLRTNRSPIMLHGRRVEVMFGYVAASLGQCSFIKQEDSGDVIVSSSGVKVPDYRILTRTDKQLFVEVKNSHSTGITKQYSLKSGYLDSLSAYAKLFGGELMLAIYWSRLNVWTLLDLKYLEKRRSAYTITFKEAVMQNGMSRLGDYHIGTRWPLTLRLLTDPQKARAVDDNGRVGFTIGNVELRCADEILTNRREKDLAFYFMLYGEWPASEPVALLEDGQLIAVDYSVAPIEPDEAQGFSMIGSLSGMISQRFNELTAPEGEIEKLVPLAEPGALGVSIPVDYESDQLPLWRFSQTPKSESELVFGSPSRNA